MSWQAVADAFLNYLDQGKLFEMVVYSPYSGIVYGIQLFWTALMLGIIAAVWVKSKNAGVTLLVGLTMFAVLLQKGLLYPLFLKAAYLLIVVAVAAGFFMLLRKKVF